MRNRSAIGFGTLLGAATLFCSASVFGQSVRLKLNPKVGYTYSVTMKDTLLLTLDANVGPKSFAQKQERVSGVRVFRYTVKAILPDGSFEILRETPLFTLTRADEEGAKTKRYEPAPILYTFLPKGEPINAVTIDAKGNRTPHMPRIEQGVDVSGGNTIQVQFPDNEIKPGDAWSYKSGKGKGVFTAKLEGFEKRQGFQCAKIVLKGKQLQEELGLTPAELLEDAPKDIQWNPTATDQSGANVEAVCYVDVQTGFTVASEEKISGAINVAGRVPVAELGTTLPINVAIEVGGGATIQMILTATPSPKTAPPPKNRKKRGS